MTKRMPSEGETIEVRRRRAAHHAAAIAAEIAPADVVGHDDHDIGGAVGLCGCGRGRRGQSAREKTEDEK
ncbi:hypothetical protein, partial [Methyloceanibacter sp.]|uniref:hypothetical protein n=1 Tax=Methyloceanibacter sp. TaxID=1965321 RepID=UPI00351B6BB8